MQKSSVEFLQTDLTANLKDYLAQPSEIHPSDARLFQYTQISKSDTPHQQNER